MSIFVSEILHVRFYGMMTQKEFILHGSGDKNPFVVADNKKKLNDLLSQLSKHHNHQHNSCSLPCYAGVHWTFVESPFIRSLATLHICRVDHSQIPCFMLSHTASSNNNATNRKCIYKKNVIYSSHFLILIGTTFTTHMTDVIDEKYSNDNRNQMLYTNCRIWIWMWITRTCQVGD